ncbi:MAG TPA: hypothetical protein VK717_07595 [Opitutaceae bacterium]|jgi:hypothetical protein|nr:hypothetical protein [Opitutaceae bacterium]
MSPVIPAKSAALPNGVIIVGRAVGDFVLRSGINAKNKPYQTVEGQVLAGTTFCRVTEFIEPGDIPYIPKDGEEVRGFIKPSFKDNNVLVVGAKLQRPQLAEVGK